MKPSEWGGSDEIAPMRKGDHEMLAQGIAHSFVAPTLF